MNELIPINYDDDTPTVSGRELHAACGVDTPYKDWFPRMCEYGFEEGVNFNPHNFERVQMEGGREVKRVITDHRLSIPMAKEIAMIQRNEKGKKIRQYLIQIEEAWNRPEIIMARALKMANREISHLREANAALATQAAIDAPLARFARNVTASDDCILIRDLAKLLKQNGVDIGEKRLYERLRGDGYIIKQRGSDFNRPTQKAMNLGLFVVSETAIVCSDGATRICLTTKVTGKGQVYFLDRYAPHKSA